MLPLSFYGLKVPPAGLVVKANQGVPASIHITMASIDPSEEAVEGDDKPFTTLKIIRDPLDVLYDDDDEDDEDDDIDDDDVEAIRRRLGLDAFDEDEDDDDDDEDDEDDEDEDGDVVNGGPSDPEKLRKAREAAFTKALKEAEDDLELDDDLPTTNGTNGKLNKGKARASISDEDSEESFNLPGSFNLADSEFVVCTLDVSKTFQQPLDIVIHEDEECFFRVVGGRSIHLTGNYVASAENDDSDDSEEDEDDLLAGENDLYDLDEIDDSDDSEMEIDELDDLDEPRITEVDEEEVPQLIKVTKTKGKRGATELDSDEVEAVLDKLLDRQEAGKGDKKTKHQTKKLKTNEGQAVAASETTNGETKKEAKAKAEPKQTEKKADAKKDGKTKPEKSSEAQVNGNAKKVQFAEKLEQGPTPSATNGVRVVNRVTIDDRKAGTGPAAKKGDKVSMRYIGKLDDGKVFDANKKGKPFSFKLGTGVVIKGWDIGVEGMRVGGERRIIIPADLAYGSKGQPGIPGNSRLTFDMKMLSIN